MGKSVQPLLMHFLLAAKLQWTTCESHSVHGTTSYIVLTADQALRAPGASSEGGGQVTRKQTWFLMTVSLSCPSNRTNTQLSNFHSCLVLLE
eukprot:4017569-Amphidinium_carterae.1